jgi:hypothetical protein
MSINVCFITLAYIVIQKYRNVISVYDVNITGTDCLVVLAAILSTRRSRNFTTYTDPHK